MRLPKLAIENYQFTLVIIIILVLLGVVSFITMPRSEDPQVTPPGTSIIAIYPGASPQDIEQQVVDPIEEALHELSDIKVLNSNIEDGLSTTTIEFEAGSDADKKYADVVQKINTVRPQLPAALWQLSTIQWTISDVSVLQLALVSDSADYGQLQDLAEQLKDELEKVPGVKRVDTFAWPAREVRVALHTEKMAASGISISQVTRAIQAANMNIPGGHIDVGNKRFNIRTSGDYQSLDDIRSTIVHSSGTKLVYLKDIADVFMAMEDQQHIGRYNGHRSVFVNVKQKEHTNIFSVMKALNATIQEFKTSLPADISLFHAFDQSKSVAHRVNSFVSNLLQGIVLVGVLIFLFLSFRASILVMLAIPISLLIGIGFVDLSRYGLQQMTIAGLVIVLGILVDNAIVVVENISRFIKMGHSHTEAAIKGTNQIAWAIVSATVTTLLSFLPLMMIGDKTGDFIRSMPLTVIYTLSASLFVALTLTPFLSSRFLRIERESRDNWFQRQLTRLIDGPYQRALHYSLNHRRLVLALSMLTFLLSLILFKVVGTSLFPKAEKPMLIINIETPSGSSLDKTTAVALRAEKLLLARTEVVSVITNIGRGNPRIYYNVISKHEQSTVAQLIVQLKKYEHRQIKQLIHELRDRFRSWPDATIEVKELEQGPPVEAPITIKVLGNNLDELRRYAEQVTELIQNTPGTVNVNNPLRTTKTDLHINVNRAKAGLFGVPLAEIDRTVRTCIAGLPVSSYRDSNGDKYQIVLRLPLKDKPELRDFDRIYVQSVTGVPIPLRQLATIEFSASPLQISHYNLARNVMITADVEDGFRVSNVTDAIIKGLKSVQLPPGYRFHIGGEYENKAAAFGGISKAIIVAVVGIIGVLVLQFRSFRQPLIVFTAFPLAIIGSTLALLITGHSFSFTAFVGLASLAGIVVNNSIILVDYTNQLREQGMSIRQAVQEAGLTRFRPILLTTGTTIGGLLPLTLRGGTLWAPMGWTIIGGLLVSTILTLVIVPVLYTIYTRTAQ